MLCESCGKYEAKYLLRQADGGAPKELRLCPLCAAALRGRAAGEACPVCGATAEEVIATGYAGCPECYRAFAPRLAPYIAKLHGHSAHRGRVPTEAMTDEEKRRIEASSLREEMEQAVKTENFERAAELRDRLKALNQTKAD